MEHLVELRHRLIVSLIAYAIAVVICYLFSKQLFNLVIRPFEVAQGVIAQQRAPGKHGPFDVILVLLGIIPAPPISRVSMIYTAPLEQFLTYLKLSGIAGLVIAFPVIGYQLYRFIAPGLYKRERAAFLPFLAASPILFLMGAALVYYVMLPFVMVFSLNQQIDGVTQYLPRVDDYLKLATALLLAMGLCFQLPVILTLLGMAGIVSSQALSAGRRYAIVGVFAVAAVVTPPDPISMLSLAFPICALYFISIWCVKLMELRRRKDEAEAEDA
ncbi:MAG TPA: twin-arginine translocase subunit TatC [Caulobacteraceae bacterium]